MKLKFASELRNYFPDEIEVQASTPLDALSLICQQHPLVGKIKPIPMRFLETSSYEVLTDTSLQDKTFHIVSMDFKELQSSYQGAGGGDNGRNWTTVVVGVALVALSFFTPVGAVLGAKGTSILFSVGASIALQGLMAVLSPKPEKADNRRSRIFSGSKTTTEIGTPIQFLFGEIRAYGQLISFNIDARNFDGVDTPQTSPYFKGKTNQNLPQVNVDKFYGIVQAGDKTAIKQDDNKLNRTGGIF